MTEEASSGSTDGLVREMHGDIKVLRADVVAIRADVAATKQHAIATNGAVAAICTKQIEQAAVIATLRFLAGLALGITGASAASAGVVLTIVKLHG